MSDLLQPYILDPFEGEGKLIDNIEGAPVYYLAFSRLGLMEYDLTYCDGCANTPALRASIQEGRPHITGDPLICDGCRKPIASYYSSHRFFVDVHGHLHGIPLTQKPLHHMAERAMWEYGEEGYIITWKHWAITAQEAGDPGSLIYDFYYKITTEEKAMELAKSFGMECLKCMTPYWWGHVCDPHGASCVARSNALHEQWHAIVTKKPENEVARIEAMAEVHRGWIALNNDWDGTHAAWNDQHYNWLREHDCEVGEK